jgi:hypothetical protein
MPFRHRLAWNQDRFSIAVFAETAEGAMASDGADADVR